MTLDDIANSEKIPQLRTLVTILSSEFPNLKVYLDTVENKTKLKVKDKSGRLIYTYTPGKHSTTLDVVDWAIKYRKNHRSASMTQHAMPIQTRIQKVITILSSIAVTAGAFRVNYGNGQISKTYPTKQQAQREIDEANARNEDYAGTYYIQFQDQDTGEWFKVRK